MGCESSGNAVVEEVAVLGGRLVNVRNNMGPQGPQKSFLYDELQNFQLCDLQTY